MKHATYARYRFPDGAIEVHSFEGAAPFGWVTKRGIGTLIGAAVIANSREQAEALFADIDTIIATIRARTEETL